MFCRRARSLAPARNGRMLFMLFKNFMWAAWWPYYTMLLAMEKAANQAAPNRPKSPPQPPQAPPQPPSRQAPRPEPQAPDTRVVRHEQSRESSMSANDAFMKPEQVMRELMKLSIEQAKRAFETFVTTSEKTWKSLENASPSGRASLYALNAKIAEITRHECGSEFRPGDAARRNQGHRSGHRAAKPARQEADGHLRAPIGGDARPRRADHPGRQPGTDR